MYAETLLRSGRMPETVAEEDDAWERSALTTISANTVTMQRLVEDLLDASSMRGDGLRIHRVPRRVGDAFESARVMLSPLAEAAGVSLSFLSDEDAAEAVGAIDPERVVQLLSNLVGNAVKFTPSGGRVDVHFTVQGGVLVAAVRDTGPGIAAEEIPHLFTAFWTGEQKAGARNGHGAGLGLWIARGIAEAHGGELEAESELGKGATFRFRIPLETGTGLIA
jgi:signal transduction histidine kinase